MLGPFATASRRMPPVLHCHSPGVATVTHRHCRTLPAHQCPQQHQRQRVAQGTAMAPWNGPNQHTLDGSMEHENLFQERIADANTFDAFVGPRKRCQQSEHH